MIWQKTPQFVCCHSELYLIRYLIITCVILLAIGIVAELRLYTFSSTSLLRHSHFHLNTVLKGDIAVSASTHICNVDNDCPLVLDMQTTVMYAFGRSLTASAKANQKFKYFSTSDCKKKRIQCRLDLRVSFVQVKLSNFDV